MRTSERLIGLKRWTIETLCRGREMKAPAESMALDEIVRTEPKCYLAWAPSRMNENGQFQTEAQNVVPGILIMPNQAFAKYTEEKRFDRYDKIRRPQEYGQHLAVSMLFSVYEPGIRLPGFVGSGGAHGEGLDMSKLLEATEEGLLTLLGWMDDCMAALIGQKRIPHTDLSVEEDSITYSLYTDMNYVVDKRPIYFGFVNVSFMGYAEEAADPPYLDLLK